MKYLLSLQCYLMFLVETTTALCGDNNDTICVGVTPCITPHMEGLNEGTCGAPCEFDSDCVGWFEECRHYGYCYDTRFQIVPCNAGCQICTSIGCACEDRCPVLDGERGTCNSQLESLCLGPAPGAIVDSRCVSGLTSVQISSGKEVLVQDLNVGDEILVSTGKYEKVYGFGHWNPNAMAEFIKIETTTAPKTMSLEISSEHLLYKANRSVPIRADSLQVGDYLESHDGKPVEVTSITLVTRRGVYSPLTQEGTFMAGGMKLSSYTAAHDKDAQFAVSETKLLLSHHDLAHTAIAPFRWMCASSSNNSFCSLRNAEGQLLWVAEGERIVAWLHPMIIGVVFATMVVPLRLLELCSCSSCLYAVAVVAAICCMGWKRKKQKHQ